VRMEDLTAQDLGDAVHGDFRAFSKLLYQPHEVLRKAQASRTDLTLGIPDLRRVLVAFGQGLVQPEELGQWASFIRRGYIASGAGMREDSRDPLVPLDITYDPHAEEIVSSVIARLDEIGDIMDGEITPSEVLEMLQGLTPGVDAAL
jgi:hypothetical protein